MKEESNDHDDLIVDRGIKTNIKDCIADKKKLLIALFGLIIAVLALIFLVFGKLTIASYYQVIDEGRLVEMRKVQKDDIKLTEAALVSFAEDSVMLTFGLTYKDYNSQLNRVSNRYYDEAYAALVKELERSNFINLLVKYHRTNTIIPTSTVFDIQGVSPKVYEVYRTYMFETVGDDGVKRHEVLYVTKVEIIEKTQKYFYGLRVLNIHKVNLVDYIKKHGINTEKE